MTMPEAMHVAMLNGCSEQTTQRNATDERNARLQDNQKSSSVGDPRTPVDNRDFVIREARWERAGDGCSCWVNPNPFTYYGIVEPGSALEPDPRCKKHFPRWQVACLNWTTPDAPHALVYCLVDGTAYAERFFATWGDAVAWCDRNRNDLERWAKKLAQTHREVAS